MRKWQSRTAFLGVLLLLLSLFLTPTFSFAAGLNEGNTSKEQEKHCVTVLGEASKIIKQQCYNTKEERDKDNPRRSSNSTTALGISPNCLTGCAPGQLWLVLFASGSNGTGSTYRIDGYSGCNTYYYVNNLQGFIPRSFIRYSGAGFDCTNKEQDGFFLPNLQLDVMGGYTTLQTTYGYHSAEGIQSWQQLP